MATVAWLPFIEQSQSDGQYRLCQSVAGPLRERIVVRDDENRRCE